MTFTSRCAPSLDSTPSCYLSPLLPPTFDLTSTNISQSPITSRPCSLTRMKTILFFATHPFPLPSPFLSLSSLLPLLSSPSPLFSLSSLSPSPFFSPLLSSLSPFFSLSFLLPLLSSPSPSFSPPITSYGPFPPGVTNGQPATTYGGTCVVTGWLLTSTRGFGAVGCAWPPCAHITVAPKCKMKPAMLNYG